MYDNLEAKAETKRRRALFLFMMLIVINVLIIVFFLNSLQGHARPGYSLEFSDVFSSPSLDVNDVNEHYFIDRIYLLVEKI